MQFSYLDPQLPAHDLLDATKKFERLFTELGVREDNIHVGTGLGGNNFQLLTLMNFEHALLHRRMDIRINRSEVSWGADWLIRATHKKIRARLDEVFASLPEEHKYLAVIMNDLARTNSMRDTVQKYADHFPKLMNALNSKVYRFDSSLTYVQQFILASVMCQELSSRLDKGDRSLVQPIGSVLYDFPPEIILLSIRRYITLERLVKHNLDEDSIFERTLNKVNKILP